MLEERRLLAGLPVAALLIFLAWAAFATATKRSWPGGDDTFITLVSARNLADAHGSAYNAVGGEPTEGFSSSLHVLLLSLAHKAGLDLLVSSRGISILSFLLIPIPIALCVATACSYPFSKTPPTWILLDLGKNSPFRDCILASLRPSLHVDNDTDLGFFLVNDPRLL